MDAPHRDYYNCYFNDIPILLKYLRNKITILHNNGTIAQRPVINFLETARMGYQLNTICIAQSFEIPCPIIQYSQHHCGSRKWKQVAQDYAGRRRWGWWCFRDRWTVQVRPQPLCLALKHIKFSLLIYWIHSLRKMPFHLFASD